VCLYVLFSHVQGQNPTTKISPKRLASPRTPRGESDAFVLPFAMPASFRAEAWKDRQRIDTPEWQVVNQGSWAREQDSSNEDISDETYLKMHTRCFDALRKENLQILNNVARKKKGDISKECETHVYMKKKVAESPMLPTFNYDTNWSMSKPWKKPKQFIKVLTRTAVLAPADDSPPMQKQAPKRAREPQLSVTMNAKPDVLQDLVANHQVTLLKLRYLHLRKQLALLRQGALESSPDVSRSNVLTFSVNSGGTEPVDCLTSTRKTTRANAGVRKKKLDEL